jgi:hypothetical protein
MNHLYYGDNLSVLREHIADASIDLIYLDPPFNSNASYNVLFKGQRAVQGAVGERERGADRGLRRHLALDRRRRGGIRRGFAFW